MKNYRSIFVFGFACVVLVALLIVFSFLPAQAKVLDNGGPNELEVVAAGLVNPRGLLFGPDGSLYIAEAGSGGEGGCIPGPEGDVCYGATGQISKVSFDGNGTPTSQDVIVSGLASLAGEDGSAATGPQDVAMSESGDLYFLVGLGSNPDVRAPEGPLGDAGMDFGQLALVGDGGTWTNEVDISAYEGANNPDGAQVDSNPFALLEDSGTFKVVDAGGNDLLGVDLEESAAKNTVNAAISTIAFFDKRLVEFPPGTGNMIPMDAVPTAVEVGPDGAYYVSQLTGFPFPVGGANIFRVVPGEEPEVYLSGFTNVLDLAFGPDGALYVLEMAKDSLAGPPPPMGQVIQVAPSGVRTIVASEGLIAPTDMEIGPDNALYISNIATSPTDGQVVRVPLPSTKISLDPAKDNTLYESETGALSNGVGEYFFAGTTNNSSLRRGLVGFDINSAVPQDSVVLSATLELHMSKTRAGDTDVTLHKYTSEWGEGNSDAIDDEGAGAAAAPGDATWLHTFFDTATWTSPGGDFVPAASATTSVGGVGVYAWSSEMMVSDLQACLDANVADSSCGWLVMGDESQDMTAKRFDTRENEIAANRPKLTLDFIAPLPKHAVFAPVISSPE